MVAERTRRSVLLAEQFAAGHDRGSSHGSARIVRRAYADAFHTALTGRAFELWRELERQAGTRLLRMLGGLDFGSRRGVAAIAEQLAAAGVAREVLPAREAEARWPGMRFEGDVVFHEQAGTVDAAGAVEAFAGLAAGHGAEVEYSKPVVSITADGVVAFADGTTTRADQVVVAAGAWVADLIASSGAPITLPPLRVIEQQVFHFPRSDPAADPWPSVIHQSAEYEVYHLAGGRDGGAGDDRKIGEHDGQLECHPDSRTGEVDAAARERARRYVREWVPGLSDVPASETTCPYTNTPSENFVLDRVGRIVVCSPCSGHGAKFAPLIGELVADLVDGTGEVPARFRLAAHESAPAAAVSL